MSRTDLAAVVAVCLTLATVIVAPTIVVSANSTERTRACVESGGAYLRVPETSAMECVR